MLSGLHIATFLASPGGCTFNNDAGCAVVDYANMAKAKKKQAKPRNHLREWRKFRHLTQEQLAEKVGTDKSVISLLESSARGLSDKWAHRLAPLLGTSPGYLLDHDPANLPTGFIDLWNQIPEENRSQAMQILETFRKRA